MIPEELTTQWEVAYRRYATAARLATTTPDGPDTARAMATTSQAVADAWRTIATVATLPWWTVAALSAAAEAYESQARDWSLRTPRPAPTPYPRAQPQPAPDDDPTAPLVPQPTNGFAHRAAQDEPVFWPNT